MVQLLVFLPLFGFLFAFLFGRQVGAMAAQVVTTGFLMVSAVLAWIIFIAWGFGDAPTERIMLMEWIISGDLEVAWALRVDTLTAVMLVVVCTVSALVHLYSFGYMSHDKAKAKFFAYLSLFTFAMLMLVTADNLLQMFFGWEGVGLASYLLIGFWSDRPSANAAAIKAFVVNRVGDFGFLLGIFTIFALSGVIQLDAVFSAGPAMSQSTFNFLGLETNALELACFLLFVGAMGKSAQFGLHTWLPDAMEGPTPVSALIHAATMVTAGVFMVARMSPLYEFAPNALTFVTFIGATTAMFAATIGCAQTDIKRVIAYSTCSQLGYMFVALGVGAYGIAIFHLFTHAFFKALLFLGAGSVIHAMHDEQDMRNMGGLWKKIPYTYAAMLVGTLALTGFPLTAGYFSKDLIIEASAVAAEHLRRLWLLDARVRRLPDGVLFLAPRLHDLPRSDPRAGRHVQARARVRARHADPTGGSVAGRARRRLCLRARLRERADGSLLERRAVPGGRQSCAAQHARAAAVGDPVTLRGDGDRLRLRRDLLCSAPLVAAEVHRGGARRASVLPEQVVHRRALRRASSCGPCAGSAGSSGRTTRASSTGSGPTASPPG